MIDKGVVNESEFAECLFLLFMHAALNIESSLQVASLFLFEENGEKGRFSVQ